jgi:hypothetical protein
VEKSFESRNAATKIIAETVGVYRPVHWPTMSINTDKLFLAVIGQIRTAALHILPRESRISMMIQEKIKIGNDS